MFIGLVMSQTNAVVIHLTMDGDYMPIELMDGTDTKTCLQLRYTKMEAELRALLAAA
jgi:hypothetical protein